MRAASIARAALSVVLTAIATTESFGESLLDPTFGTGGLAAIPVDDSVSAMAVTVLRDGSSVVALYGARTSLLSRLSPAGAYDASFGARAGALTATAIFQDRNGRLIVASASGTSLTRLADDGRVDTSFGTQGTSTWNNGLAMEDPRCRGGAGITSLQELPDGKLALFGYTATFDGFLTRSACMLLARVDSSGLLDPIFAGRGAIATAAIDRASLAFGGVLPDGSMWAIGTAESNASPGVRSVMWTVDALGRPVSLVTGEARGLQQPDGSSVELLLQDADTAAQKVRLRVRKIDGSVDTVFGNGGESEQIDTTAQFNFVRRTPDGGVVAVGRRADVLSPPYITYRPETCVWRFDGRLAGCEILPAMDSFSFRALLAPGGSLYVAAQRADRGPGAMAARFNVTPPNIEYFNTVLKHYFVTYDGQEARGIDNGAAGEGWIRTGQSTFKTGGTTPVCRFYGLGFNSHFFTVSAEECERVKRDPGWIFEGYGFYATPTVNGQCADGLQPVHRLYNNRAAMRDSNHRHITDLSLVPAMQAQGWYYEGVAFCVRP